MDLNSSPLDFLREFRGAITDAHLAHPDVLHVEVRDASGRLWRLATLDAGWSPRDPAKLVGRSIERTELDEANGKLICTLSDGAVLLVTPTPPDTGDDPPNWELFGPDHLLLVFGPGLRWRVARSNEPAG